MSDVADGSVRSPKAKREEYSFKVILIGDPLVGKTSFVQRYVNDSFRRHYKLTMGVDYAMRVIRRPGNKSVKMQIWDIAGQERFTSLTRVYYKGAHGCIIMIDLTERNTLSHSVRWKKDLDSKCTLADGSPVPCLLIANKCDASNRQILEKELENVCKDHEFIGWSETSVKDGIMVEESMEFMADSMLAKATEHRDRGDSETSASSSESVTLTLTSGPRHLTKTSRCDC